MRSSFIALLCALPLCIYRQFSDPLYFMPCVLWRRIDLPIASWPAWQRRIMTARLTLRSNPSARIGLLNVAILFSLGSPLFLVNFIGHPRQVLASLLCRVL